MAIESVPAFILEIGELYRHPDILTTAEAVEGADMQVAHPRLPADAELQRRPRNPSRQYCTGNSMPAGWPTDPRVASAFR
jgi:hypothetical protein